MPQQQASSVENSFIGGLKTEFTGLNFPENACTDVDNCIFSLIGDIVRREGIDFELNAAFQNINRGNVALSTYKWNNVGGDGLTQMLVVQIGGTLAFFQSTSATIAAPLSTTLLGSGVTLSSYSPSGAPAPDAVECQFTDGNGYLFVFHPNLTPFYCTFTSGTINAFPIDVQIRDFDGLPEAGMPTNNRPTTLSTEHTYNLFNQGWNQGANWTATDVLGTWNVVTGSHAFTVASSISGITNGERVHISATDNNGSVTNVLVALGSVTSYSGTTLTINVDSAGGGPGIFDIYTITPVNAGLINTWLGAVGNYPSNGDVWWQFKDDTDVFNPGTTVGNVTLNSGPAPKGYFIIDAFTQNRSYAAGIPGITNIDTLVRPKTGTWFQGRIWYAGVDAAQAPTGDAPYYTWTESIYFSQTVTNTSQFGMCYQNNDPTSEDLFDLLPTDGGVINIQGSGSIYKLFPIQNGLLVFAANGIWFITGSQGIGFSANDYTITKISSVQNISGTSHINVLGYPIFWNEEGIYSVTPSKQGGGLVVENICLGTILTYYSEIPVMSKKFVRGDYNPLTFVISWVFRSTNESTIASRYQFDSVLNLNTANKAFYPYSIPNSSPYLHDIKYITSPGGSTAPDPTFKYLTSFVETSTNFFTFSEERDSTNWVDFFSVDSVGINYVSNFITGYKLHGQALRKWQPQYVYVFSKRDVLTAYKIQGIWDYAIAKDSNRFSATQIITNGVGKDNYGTLFRRHRIRGHGLALQLQITSVDNMPFNLMGWAIYETSNAGV